MKTSKILGSMTLDEKIALVSGADQWRTIAIPRLDLPSLTVADGPHGLRKQDQVNGQLGLGPSETATCFPTSAATASSWDPDLLFSIGEAIGKEALQAGVSVVLGPGANLKRSPLGGRNFEYFSEDPLLTGKLAAAWVQGVQSVGVGASLKHFAANNQEKWRMTNNSVIDERALREIYLAGFEYAVKESQPWTVMSAYNLLNGTYCSENEELLTTILREEWGFQGVVLSDWGAVNDPVASLKAGLDLEMPSSFGLSAAQMQRDLKTGRLTEAMLNKAVKRILNLVLKSREGKEKAYDPLKHHLLARKAAAESAVLLKNEEGLLPLSGDLHLAVIGELAKSPRYQGAGSSEVKPTQLDTVYDELTKRGGKFSYAAGYSLNLKEQEIEEGLLAQACNLAREADAALIFLGLPAGLEAEGYDRPHLSLPAGQEELVRQVAAVNRKVVVVLSTGAPVAMPWLEKAGAVLQTYLAGQAGAAAAVEILLGEVNPSGKLAESYPLQLADVAAHPNFAVDRENTKYEESIFVGYRYYDTAWQGLLFPFGHGLSYTDFQYSGLSLSSPKIISTDALTVRCRIKNSGARAGAEIVQLYVSKDKSVLFRPEQELKGFQKVFLEPGESKEVEFTLGERAFAYYNVQIKDWHVEEGQYEIRIGASSRDIRLVGGVFVQSPAGGIKAPDYRKTAPAYYNLNEGGFTPQQGQFQAVFGRPLPLQKPPATAYHENSTLEDLQATLAGRVLVPLAKKQLMKMLKVEDEEDPLFLMAWRSVYEMPLRSLVALSGGQIPAYAIQGLLAWANGQYGKAFKHWARR